MRKISSEKSIAPCMNVPLNVEVTQRMKGDQVFTFILNHNEESVEIDFGESSRTDLISHKVFKGVQTIAQKDVLILF